MKTKEKSKLRLFLEQRNILLSPKVYFIDAMGSMALGLFASLLIATFLIPSAPGLPGHSWQKPLPLQNLPPAQRWAWQLLMP